MRIILVGLLVTGLTGCVETSAPPPPSPALQRLMDACKGGNIQACTTIAELEESRRASMPPPPVFQPTYIDPGPFMNRNRNVRTVCNPTFGGGVNCTSM